MLDGPTHCTNCHVGGGGDHKLKCLSCHVEIRQRLATGQGLHPSLLGKGNPEDQCAKCHAEHNGENFALIRWEGRLEDFDHRKTGYALEGAHAGLACAKCHNPERIPASSRQEIRIKDLRRTYLGLSRQCAACHRDEHRGQLGLACEKCHAISKWKEGAKFDHSSTKFPLAGAHAQAPCQKCHPAEASRDGGKPSVKYAGIAFAQCTACHKDVHQGAFPAPCISCHTESAWKPVRNLTTSFDHSKTKFPLMGKHAALACEKCHRTSDFHAPIAHDRCDGCHKDVHGGQFAARVDRGDCAACHTVEGWKPSTFNAAAHAATAYPLLGKHSALACATCHKPAGAATVYRIRFALCTDCHSDPHQGQLAKSACSDCHDVGGFRPANFALARHEQTTFPLRGAHVAVA
jgi:hypothetical protein